MANNNPVLLTPVGEDEPLWGECSDCRKKFSPDAKLARKEQEIAMRENFLRHLKEKHSPKPNKEDFSQAAARIVREATED